MNFLKNTVLEATRYVSGFVNEDDDYVISASMLGKEPLQNYLSIIHGKIHTEEIDDTTLGSVFHRGMEEIMKDKLKEDTQNGDHNIVGVEQSMYVKLSNGWILSGTADLITEESENVFGIHDYKLSKSYALKMLKKDLHSHDYTKQLQALDALFVNSLRNHSDPVTTNLYIEFFVKDAKAIEKETSHTTITAPSKAKGEGMDPAEMVFQEVVQITDSLQSYIESAQVPPMCEDRWPRNVKGKVIPTKCALYCSHGKAGLCPHYKNSERTNIDMIANW